MSRRGLLLGAGGLAALLLLGAAQSARAATVSTVVQGDVVRLVSTLDAEAAAHMPLGVPVSWDVAVSAVRDDGVIDVGLTGTATPDAYTVAVRTCAVAWTASGCARGERSLGTAPAGSTLALARQPSGEEQWYRIDVVLEREIGGATATLVFGAAGRGTTAPSTLPVTGEGVLPLVAPALGAIALGLIVAGAARWRRGRSA